MRPSILTYLPSEPSAVSVEVQFAGPQHGMRRMPPHRHLFFEVLVIVEGRGAIEVAGHPIALDPRTVVALPPGVEHDCRSMGEARGWSIIFLAEGAGASGDRAFDVGESLPDDAGFDAFKLSMLQANHPIVLDEREYAIVLSRIADMQRELSEKAAYYDVMVRGALQMMLVTVGRAFRATMHADAPVSEPLARAFLADIFDDIDRHYGSNATLHAAAQRLGMQPGHLTTKLRRLTGRTFGMWLIERRMIEARRLLTGTDLSLAAIAERVGYAEVESFVRRFRTHHRATPALWRKSARTRMIGASDAPSADELRSIDA